MGLECGSLARDGDFPSESAGVQFGCVLSDLFPFLSVVAWLTVACLLVLPFSLGLGALLGLPYLKGGN